MIETGVLIFLVIAVFVIVLAVMGIKIVRQSETMVIERLGKFNRVLDSGVNIIWPIVDRPREIEWKYMHDSPDGHRTTLRKKTTKIDLRENVYDFPKQNVITKDNVVTEINALLYFQITEPRRAVYEIANLPDAIEKLTQTSLRNVIGDMELDQVLTSRDKINGTLQKILDDASEKWGVKVNRVELQDINPPEDIKTAMEKQMRAERDRRAAILEAEGSKRSQILMAEGDREAAINRAEGEKQKAILEAEGRSQAIERVAEAEQKAIQKISAALRDSQGDPSQYLIAVKYIGALKEMVSGQDNKVVYIPYEATAILGSIGGIKDLLVGKNLDSQNFTKND